MNEEIKVGVWHVLPEELIDVTLKTEDYEEELMKGEYPVLFFLHGNNNLRTDNVPIYQVLRKYFHIIAYDYRGKNISHVILFFFRKPFAECHCYKQYI